MEDPIKARLPVLLFLGSIFMAMACTSVGLAYREKEKPNYRVCVKSCDFEKVASRNLACYARCKMMNHQEEEEEDPHHRRPWPYRPEEQEEEKGRRHHQDPEERARERDRREEEKREDEERRRREQQQKREQEQRQEQEQEQQQGQEQQQEEEEKEKQKKKRHNPYHLSSEKFQTRFENEYGQIRVLQRFDQLSEQLSMLRYYRLVEFKSKPGTLVQPHHSDAEYLVVVTVGRAIFTIVLENYKQSFNVEQYDVLRIPAGAICYVINQDNSRNLRFIKLVLPVNIPGQFENFYPSGNHIPKSYYTAFSKRTLQASFNSEYDEIKSILFGEQQEQSSEGVIVKLSKQQIRALVKKAQSSRWEKPSPLGPFNLKKLQPRYSNEHGSLLEAHPHSFQPLQDLGIAVSSLQLNEGSLFLPHYNTRAIVLAYVDKGEGHLEIGCPHKAGQGPEEEGDEESEGEEEESESEQEEERQPQEGQGQEEEHKEGQIKRFASRLSRGHLFVLPAGHPVAITASNNRNLRLIEFILNAPYNTRQFLAGKKDNIINQIDREVKDAAFEGSGEQVERLLEKQEGSYFVESQDQPSEEGRSKRKGNAWSSVLKAFI